MLNNYFVSVQRLLSNHRWDYRKCHELLLQERSCSNRWYAVDAEGNCICIPRNSACDEENRVAVPRLFPYSQQAHATGEKEGLPGLYFNSNGGTYTVQGCEPVTCDGTLIDGTRLGHSDIPTPTLSNGFKAPQQKFGSTLVFSCLGGYFKGKVTYTCRQNGFFKTEDTCEEIVCVRPENSAYNFDNVQEQLNVPEFKVTGIQCAAGYKGLVQTRPCNLEFKDSVGAGTTVTTPSSATTRTRQIPIETRRTTNILTVLSTVRTTSATSKATIISTQQKADSTTSMPSSSRAKRNVTTTIQLFGNGKYRASSKPISLQTSALHAAMITDINTM